MSQSVPASGSRAPEPQWLGHPRGLFVLFMSEMWERFNYYGMRALLTLYMVKGFLHYGEKDAAAVYGAYTTLVYLFPLLGGLIADKIFGYRKAVLTGGVLMAAGEFLLMVSNDTAFHVGLGLLCVGNGFFKPNISSIVGKLYAQGDPRRDRGFTIFYMGINIGAFASPLLCGYVGEEYGWNYGFGLAGIGMLIGLATFAMGQKVLDHHGLPPAGGATMRRNLIPGLSIGNAVFVGALAVVPLAAFLLQNPGMARWLLLVLGAIMLVPMLKAAFQSDTAGKHRVFVYLILWVFHTAFWAMFEQAGSSLTLLADNYVDRKFTWLPNGEFNTTWFQSVNPLFIVLLAPLFTILWRSLQKVDRDPSIPMKFGLGVVQLALGYVVLVWGMRHFAPQAVTPFSFLFVAYVMHTMGELCLSPVGLSAVTKLAPEKAVGFFMGFWFLSISAAQNIAGAIAGETASTTEFAAMTVGERTSQLAHYADVYWQGALILLGMGVFLMVISRLVNKLAHGVR